MIPKKYLQKMAAAIVNRSGIARPTVEALLPHVFDEIRYILTEGNGCVPIEGFGTFAVIDKPEREYLYNHKGVQKIVRLPAKRVLKFAPTKNMKREVEQGQYDPTRRSFSRHHDDPAIRKRKHMGYQKRDGEVHKGKTTYFKRRTTQ